MTSHEIAWKSRAENAFAPLRSIHRSWLPDSLRQQTPLLDVAILGSTTRKMLYAHVAKLCAPMRGDKIDAPAWGRGDYAAQRNTVLRLGAFACADPLRRTIEQAELTEVRRAIDADVYREAVTQDGALVQSDVFAAYRDALQAGDIGHFIAAMGLSVLQSVVPQDKEFVERRLRYYFARKAWALRQSNLTCNRDRFHDILSQAVNV